MTRTWPSGLIELADGVFAYVQEGGGLCVSNAGLIVGPEGCIVIDALFAPSMTRAFREEIARLTDKPVRLLINTHHHVDHSLGNALFPEAQILSHANARREQQRVGAGVLDRLRPLLPELVAEVEGVEMRLPDLTFESELTLHLGERTVRLVHLGTAHTIGDALVLLPDERLLFAGDVAFHYVTPLAFEGHVGGWLKVCDRVDALEVDTIVPGHGPVGGKAELRETRGYLASIREQARAAFDAGRSEEEATRGVDLGEYASWAEGCIVIDALFAPSMTRAFREEIARVTDKPVRLLINTHHHVDHSLGNALFPEAQILSHANARREQQRVGTGVLDRLRPLLPDLVAEVEGVEIRLPDLTFEGELTLHLGERTVRLVHLGTAHTIGDALVLLPDERLLFAGDVAFHYVTPLAFEGHVGGWLKVCDRVDSLEVDTIVPGHGPVGGKAELRETRGYLDSIREQARAAFDAGRSEEEATRGIDLGEYASWAEPERLALNVGRLYQEFRGEI